VGTLYLVATPIGNLEDVTLRALRVLGEAELVLAEDTRRTRVLLERHAVDARPRSLHAHNEAARTTQALDVLAGGGAVALVSDAGTPLLSDPGYVLVRSALERGVRVDHVPGPSAILTALVVSGLPPYPFTFLGFAPPRSAKRKKFFSRMATYDHTVVFFESPHRVIRSLEDLLEVLGDRPVAVARELTKMHEEVLRGPLSEVVANLQGRPSIKGEFTVVIGRASPATS